MDCSSFSSSSVVESGRWTDDPARDIGGCRPSSVCAPPCEAFWSDLDVASAVWWSHRGRLRLWGTRQDAMRGNSHSRCASHRKRRTASFQTLTPKAGPRGPRSFSSCVPLTDHATE